MYDVVNAIEHDPDDFDMADARASHGVWQAQYGSRDRSSGFRQASPAPMETTAAPMPVMTRRERTFPGSAYRLARRNPGRARRAAWNRTRPSSCAIHSRTAPNDGWDAAVDPQSEISDEIGSWRPTEPAFSNPLAPQWGSVTPWAVDGSTQFLPPPPPDLNSAEYTAAFDETKDLGGQDSTSRTPRPARIALVWADGAGAYTPPGHWNVSPARWRKPKGSRRQKWLAFLPNSTWLLQTRP